MSTATPDALAPGFGPEPLARALSPLLSAWPDVRLAVALSGGPDSAALLAAVAALAHAEPAIRLRALHVNHGLQADAHAFAAAARAQARALGVPFAVLDVAVARAGAGGLEAAARAARYAALGAALAPGEALLTAHHEDDQAETVLLQLLRGGGVDALAAMPARAALGQGFHLRPCLGARRAALAACAARAGLSVVADPMNSDPRFERAYLRTRVAPRLAERWPAWSRTLARAAGHFAQAQELLGEVAAVELAACARGAALDAAAVAALSPPRQALVLRQWLRNAGHVLPNTARLEAIRAMLGARAAACPEVRWPGVVVFRHAGRLHAMQPVATWPQAAIALAADAPAVVPGLGCVVLRDPGSGAVDGAAARIAPGAPLRLQRRAGGERLRLHAGGHRRPVKDLLREARVPAVLRDRLALLWRGEECIGVLTPAGLWLDCAARAAPGAPAVTVDWHDIPAALRATFIEATTPLP